MLTFFRSFFQSKIGIVVTLAFLGLIALAFASADISSTGTFGGVAGGNRVAVVGDEKIGSGELSRSATSALDQVRQQNPTLTMQTFVEQGGLGDVLDAIIDRYALGGFGQMIGLRAGDNLVNSEILGIGAFAGPDGNFSDEIYRAAIGRQALTDAQVRRDLADGLLARQVVVPAQFGAVMPEKLARRYAALFRERREGTIGFLPSAAFAPAEAPSAQALNVFYQENRSDYVRPERRVIRYASFGDEAIDANITPTASEIAARYRRDAAQYAASEERTITQIIVPTQQAANALRARIDAGASLEAVGQEASFRAGEVGPIRKAALQGQFSAAVANAVFAGREGSTIVPARSSLGWHVARIDDVTTIGGRTPAQARPEIVAALTAEKRRNAIADLSARIEERLDDGESLADVARTLDVELQTTRPVTAAGRVYGSAEETAPAILASALATAFQMEENEPQLAEVERGETFLIFDVTRITPSATAPLSEIREEVTVAWRLAEGSAKARAATDRVLKRIAGGATMAAALAAEKGRIPPVENINLTREQLAQQGNQQVPPPLALMFSMAEGTTKKLEAARNLGWFAVSLTDIDAGTLAEDDPIVQQARTQLGGTVGEEYAAQLQRAIRGGLGVSRNEEAIDGVRKQLLGEN